MSEYKLLVPMFDWAKGELFTYDGEWNEWTRKRTGEELNLRGSIAQGEKAMLLNFAKHKQMTTVLKENK